MAYIFRQGDLYTTARPPGRRRHRFQSVEKQWEAYFSLSGLDAQDDDKQVQALTLCFSQETLTIVENLGLTDEQRGKTKEIIATIEDYVNGQINESVERCIFRSCVQQEGETFDDFLVSL